MRPLELYMEGFTVYREPTRIDFRPLSFFAVQGSTGSGKTSIVDAITFALYGKVPRYGNTQAIKKVISKGSKSLKVSLDFSVGNKEYRIERFFSRVGRREEATVRVYEEGIRQNIKGKEVENWVSRITGIDYKTFTKVIILPQGEFDKFLKPSTPKERKDILIKLINLEALEKVRELASEEFKALERELELVKGRLRELEEVNEKVLEELKAQVESLRDRIKELKVKREEKQRVLQQAKRKREIHTELENLKAKFEDLTRGEEEIKKLKERLEVGKKLLPFLSIVEEVEALEREIGAYKKELEAIRGRLSVAEEERRTVLEEFKRTEEEFRKLELLESKLREMELRKRDLESLLDSQKKLREKEREKETLAGEVDKLSREHEEILGRLSKGESLISDSRRKLDRLEVREEAMRSLLEEKNGLELLGELNLRREKLKEEAKILENKLKELEEELSEVKSIRESREEELREKEVIYHAHLVRESLSEGDRCPVCGGVFKEGEGLSIEEKDIEKLRKELKKIEEKEKALEKEKLTVETKLGGTSEELSHLEEELKDYRPEAIKGVLEKLQTLESSLSRKREIEGKLRKYEERYKELLELKDKIGRELEAKRATLKALEEHIEELKNELVGREPAKELRKLQDSIKSIRERIKEIKENYEKGKDYIQELQENIIEMRAKIEELEKGLSSRSDRKKKLLQKLSAIYDIAPTLEDIEESALREEEIKELEVRIQRYEMEVSRVKDRLSALEDELKALADIPELEEVTSEYDELVSIIDGMSRELGVKEGEIKNLEEKLKEKRDMESRVPELEERLRIYYRLKEDLRSDRFQSFVSSMIMRDILRHASHYLERFTGTYSFDMDEKDNLLIIDSLQGGVKRSVESLSGGETFLASLSLALGVSDVLSADAHLESLFIDEGFGSLDEETRDRVGDILEIIEVEINRMVGVITHIPDFAERFTQRLIVSRRGDSSKVEVVV